MDNERKEMKTIKMYQKEMPEINKTVTEKKDVFDTSKERINELECRSIETSPNHTQRKN